MAQHIEQDYAAALFAVASEHKAETHVLKELESAAKAVEGNKQLAAFISCPAFPLSEKIEFVSTAFHGSHLFKNFLDLAVRRKAFNRLPGILTYYKQILNDSKGIENIDVVSAVELDEHNRKSLEDKLRKMTGKKLEMSYNTDKKLLAGLIIKYKDRIMDASLSNQFQTLKQELTGETK